MENKEKNTLSGILWGVLASAHQTSTYDNIWQLFGYKGFPDYGGSKLKVLFDYSNIKDKTFLLKEIVRTTDKEIRENKKNVDVTIWFKGGFKHTFRV